MVNELNQKQYKAMKKEIVELSAINVGYFPNVISHIPEYALFEAIRQMQEIGFRSYELKDWEISNILVSESVKAMNYQDFKDIAHYFFSFPQEQREAIIQARPLSISQDEYQYLQESVLELLYYKHQEQQQEQNLVYKIDTLETTTVINGDKVIGVDTTNNTLLLLRSAEDTYIGDWVLDNDNLITDYRQDKTSQQQTIRYLLKHYEDDMKVFIYEYVLNNDLYVGERDIDLPVIEELDLEEVPYFNTQRDFYEFASNYDSFNDRYASYEDYILERYFEVYAYFELGTYDEYANDILTYCLDEINERLSHHGKELILQEVYGYSQGDVWQLAYMKDNSELDEDIAYYLEHEVGAYYRGSLTELVIIPFSSITKDGYTGDYEDSYIIDSDLLYKDYLKEVKEIYPHLENYQPIELIYQQQQINDYKVVNRGLGL